MTAAEMTGIGVSPGVAAAPVARLAPPPALPADTGPEPDPEAALAEARAALEAVAADLDARADRAEGPAADVLFAQSMMPRDPALADRIAKALSDGRSTPHAIAAAFGSFRAALEAAGGYLAERAADLDDLRDRAVAALLDLPMPGLPDPGHRFVLVARDLAPADTAALDPAAVAAIVTEEGGPTSHTAILAKSMGLPAVVACPAAAGLADGTEVLVDGGTGLVVPDPEPGRVRRVLDAEARRAAALTASRGPGRTADGHAVQLLVNLGSQADLAAAAAVDSEGVGLFRTEFLFLDRETAPSVDEQVEAYGQAFAAFSGRKVVIRTLDAGADKPLAFVDHGHEPNPALGVRGIRLARTATGASLLDGQLTAIAAAAAQHAADVWVMAPMVATPGEAAAFTAQCRSHGLATAGAMIEVPAAALRASRVLESCDFASLGTNDLGQYALAADRMNGALADLLDPWQPALLDLVSLAAEAGREAEKPVGVCGEAASDPLLACVLVGLGVASLSMAPAAVAGVRAELGSRTLADCAGMAAEALHAADAADARRLVAAYGTA
ncbi:phosphoenolpyruvate--protein phosphotransferase [Glycomyces sp. TRM65418]|uniref:phosphoenolpyruvate--protein phosphotransferase n=1 Tax=Glycomyces sp. TRM65418 TaxID=2867006 RepID=UPI001CE535D2|nr:phosphoenolpyruvate--protein phosphotransferase [Glycomyces sp. TRM65418]MCC3763132.1 phosphoenolpyruvate--protein phosphotransferase [Glycomyces sp. TRM65418]QZD57139.1 phosphoenolpyruvate--protein phosphotransferase [Glycomyces sp. TRM65418]